MSQPIGTPPTAPRTTPTSVGVSTPVRMRLTPRRTLALVAGLAALVLALLLVDPDTERDRPFDPRSTQPEGLAGLVSLLESFGATVTIGPAPPPDQTTTLLVPVDQITGAQREAVRDFAREGGTVVLGGSAALTHDLEPVGGPLSAVFGRTSRAPRCDALPSVSQVTNLDWQAMRIPPGAVACFPIDDDAAWLIADDYGQGTMIAVGSASPFTNALLNEQDNAVLAVQLLAPGPGATVRIVAPLEVGEGDTPLLELVPDGVWRGLWLLLAAVAVFVLGRARRLGAPVTERLPPVLPSAELARSVGRLLLRVGDRPAAGARLRDQLRRDLRHHLGIAADVPDGALVPIVVERTAATADDVRLALTDTEADDDEALTRLAAAVNRVRRDSLHPPDSTSDTTSDDTETRNVDAPFGPSAGRPPPHEPTEPQ